MQIPALPVLICCLLFATAANAEIYKWVDAQGVAHYSDKPVRNAKPAHLPNLQSMDRTPVRARGNTTSSEEKPLSLGVDVSLEQPQPQQTFRDGRGLVPAQVTTKPALTAQQQLIYYLDGEPATPAPTSNTSLQLQGVERGEHQLSVAVVSRGQEISRSAPVTFYMKPPSALAPVSQNTPNQPSDQPTGAVTAPPTTRSPGALAAPRFNTRSGPAGN